MADIKNMGASIQARLLNKSKTEGRDYQELLQYFVMERFLYRLASSNQRDKFLLKGALLLNAQVEIMGRATRDLDFLGLIGNDPVVVADAIRRICEQPVVEDGVEFDTGKLSAERIALQDDYSGVRVKFIARVGRARLPMQVDVGIGDHVYPISDRIEYPTLLDFPKPLLHCYPLTSVVAEKLEALLSLGFANTRLKDYFDLLVISRHFEFFGEELAESLRRTCTTRGTKVEPEPTGLSEDFVVERATQWRGFLKRTGVNLSESTPELEQVVQELRAFLLPLLDAAARPNPWDSSWTRSRWTKFGRP